MRMSAPEVPNPAKGAASREMLRRSISEIAGACVGHSRARHLQYRGGLRLWIWESLASKSLAVEAKAEVTLERLPPAVLFSKRVGKPILFLGLHLSGHMLIIKTEN